MRVADMVTTAGGDRENEDRVGARGSLAWVIDGTTDLYASAALPANRDVLWLVDFLTERLGAAGTAGYQGSAVALLERLADEVGEAQERYGFPADRTPPACSLALLIDQGDSYEIARIGDATAVVVRERPDDSQLVTEVLATDFFDRREQAAVDVKRRGSSPDDVRAAMLARRRYTITSGDVESVFSGHPRRILRTHTHRGEWHGVTHVLLCTDGFARLLTDYHVYPDWRSAVAAGAGNGLGYLMRVIRDTERALTGVGARRFKRSDDAAAALVLPV